MVKERSHISRPEAPQIKWMLYTATIGLLEMSEVAKSGAVPIALGRAYKDYCPTQ